MIELGLYDGMKMLGDDDDDDEDEDEGAEVDVLPCPLCQNHFIPRA